MRGVPAPREVTTHKATCFPDSRVLHSTVQHLADVPVSPVDDRMAPSRCLLRNVQKGMQKSAACWVSLQA